MDIEQIKELMKTLSESKLAKLIFKEGDVELHLEKENQTTRVVQTISPEVMNHSFSQGEPSFKETGSIKPSKEETSATFVTSPMVGTFYSSSAPGQDPFVKVGDHVDAVKVVCIIEAMKVMNEVKAGQKGEIVEILVQNGQPVEFGTKLFRIR